MNKIIQAPKWPYRGSECAPFIETETYDVPEEQPVIVEPEQIPVTVPAEPIPVEPVKEPAEAR
jgi:hypothetical protein